MSPSPSPRRKGRRIIWAPGVWNVVTWNGEPIAMELAALNRWPLPASRDSVIAPDGSPPLSPPLTLLCGGNKNRILTAGLRFSSQNVFWRDFFPFPSQGFGGKDKVEKGCTSDVPLVLIIRWSQNCYRPAQLSFVDGCGNGSSFSFISRLTLPLDLLEPRPLLCCTYGIDILWVRNSGLSCTFFLMTFRKLHLVCIDFKNKVVKEETFPWGCLFR